MDDNINPTSVPGQGQMPGAGVPGQQPEPAQPTVGEPQVPPVGPSIPPSEPSVPPGGPTIPQPGPDVPGATTPEPTVGA